ncbi:MAG TPA: polysaccharide deacetylase family protein [Trebonia sp.]|nr:polysaccharide deacetylase family protein [Trebonia sp.]
MLTGSSAQDANRSPDADENANLEGQHRGGGPVARRAVLASLGGLLIVGTGVAACSTTTGASPGASGAGKGLAGAGTTASPTPPVRHARVAARHARVAARHEPGHKTGTTRHPAPPRPEYYIDDGPMTVALTIDDGPSPVYTPQVLRVLEQHGVHATFSMIGGNVAAYPQIAREVVSAGHLIANHTWSHASLPALRAAAMREEVTRAAIEIHAATGQRPTLFRAPYGAWSPGLLEYCAAQGLTPLDWSVDPQDWARPGVNAIVQDILRTTDSGSIILEHDGGGDRSQTVAALKIVLPRLLDRGFRFRLA